MKKAWIGAALAASLLLAGCAKEATPAPELLEPVGVTVDTAVCHYEDIRTAKVYSAAVVPSCEGLFLTVDGTVQEMLTDIIAGTLAKDQNITETMLNNYNTTADELYVDRDAVMGVDLNDEAMNMMQYQKAYSAACRLMTTFDGMLEKLINGTAI